MLANFDLNYLLTFPVKEPAARRYFLTGVLVYLASFVIPVVPLMLMMGYVMRIMRQVLDGEKPCMVAWDDWGEMLTDGARLFGVQLLFMLPLILILLPATGASFALPFLVDGSGNTPDWLAVLFPLFLGGFFLLLIPAILIVSFILPAAQVHVTDKREFGAVFRVQEWWGVFRSNLGGFLLALAFTLAISFAMSLLMQFAMLTVVLICVLPFLFPVSGMYMMLVTYALFAQAYKEGRDRLAGQAMAAIA